MRKWIYNVGVLVYRKNDLNLEIVSLDLSSKAQNCIFPLDGISADRSEQIKKSGSDIFFSQWVRRKKAMVDVTNLKLGIVVRVYYANNGPNLFWVPACIFALMKTLCSAGAFLFLHDQPSQFTVHWSFS